MRLAAPSRRRGRPEPIIALIDVVFFLLVFFMLIGRMDASAPFEVAPPVAKSGVDMPGGGETVSIAVDGSLALNGRETDTETLLAEIAVRLAEDPARRVRVNVDREAELRRILPLVGEIEALGAREVVLVVTPGQNR